MAEVRLYLDVDGVIGITPEIIAQIQEYIEKSDPQ